MPEAKSFFFFKNEGGIRKRACLTSVIEGQEVTEQKTNRKLKYYTCKMGIMHPFSVISSNIICSGKVTSCLFFPLDLPVFSLQLTTAQEAKQSLSQLLGPCHQQLC